MKIASLFGAAILFLSVTAMAHDTTYLSSVNAHDVKQVTVELPGGKSTVEVWSTDNATISCTFIDRGTGAVGYEAQNVQRCVGHADLALPMLMLARVVNNGDKNVDFRIWIHDTK